MLGLQFILDIEEMSTAELADKIGVSPSLVYRWLNGKKPLPRQRTIQIHSKVFPEYPEEYLDKDITEADKAVLNDIRRSKTGTTDFKLKKLIELASNYADDVKTTIANIAGALNATNNVDFIQNPSPNMNATIYMLMLSTVLSEQTAMLNDFKALYGLEAGANREQRGANILVSVVLSALCEALGRGGYIDDIVCSEPLRVVVSDEGLKGGTFDREIHGQLVDVFTEIVGRYDKRDKILETLNNKLKSKQEQEVNGMVNGLLQDILNDSGNRLMASHNSSYRSRYNIEKTDGVCVVTGNNCQLFESVGKYLAISDVVGSITIDKTGIIAIDGKAPSYRLSECIGDGVEYHDLCKKIYEDVYKEK